MNRNQHSLRRLLAATSAVALSLGVTACFGDDDNTPPVAGTPTPTATPTPTPTTSNLDVTRCLSQEVAPGTTVADLVVPDVLTIDTTAAAGFPNGRLLADPVIDVTLAVLFLDIDASGQSPLSFANLPLNPPSNDVAFRSGFPYLAPPQGSPPLSMGGSGFDFRSDSANAYVRVDRMGMPAVSTALIPSGAKIAYNDANPVTDATGEFVDELAGTLQGLTEALDDDLLGAGFNICAD
jgi:hypothetical protein